MARQAALVEAARELAAADTEAESLIFRVTAGRCNDSFPVRHETIDRLAAAELGMRRAAKAMVDGKLIRDWSGPERTGLEGIGLESSGKEWSGR